MIYGDVSSLDTTGHYYFLFGLFVYILSFNNFN